MFYEKQILGKKVDAESTDLQKNLSLENEGDDFYKVEGPTHAYIGHISDLPISMIDNEYIRTGYRINFNGFWVIFKTLFKWHNETFNIWSHFLG